MCLRKFRWAMVAMWAVVTTAYAGDTDTTLPRDASLAARRGHRLFHGGEPLHGRVRQHDLALPASATRCLNCHSRDAAGSLGGALSADLTRTMPRYGGPPTAYNAERLCRLLRTGITPNQVLVHQAMPVYRIADAQCTALWDYLISLPPKGGSP